MPATLRSIISCQENHLISYSAPENVLATQIFSCQSSIMCSVILSPPGNETGLL